VLHPIAPDEQLIASGVYTSRMDQHEAPYIITHWSQHRLNDRIRYRSAEQWVRYGSILVLQHIVMRSALAPVQVEQTVIRVTTTDKQVNETQFQFADDHVAVTYHPHQSPPIHTRIALPPGYVVSTTIASNIRTADILGTVDLFTPANRELQFGQISKLSPYPYLKEASVDVDGQPIRARHYLVTDDEYAIGYWIDAHGILIRQELTYPRQPDRLETTVLSDYQRAPAS
jgi:hypothetical protein